jgi:uncharacterized membrane protein SirB2
VLKTLHMTLAALTFVSFTLRGVGMLRESPWRRQRWARVLPHIVDTLLFATGITLMIVIRQYPGTVPWITAKLLAVLVYIGLGMVALRFGRRKSIRAAAWIAALIVFGYIYAVAVTRNPIPLGILLL